VILQFSSKFYPLISSTAIDPSLLQIVDPDTAVSYVPVSTEVTEQPIQPDFDIPSAFGPAQDVTSPTTNATPTPPTQAEEIFAPLDNPAPSLPTQPMVVLFDGCQYPYSVVLKTIMSTTSAITEMPDGMLYTVTDLQEGMASFHAAQQAALEMVQRYEQQQLMMATNPPLGSYGALPYPVIQQVPMPVNANNNNNGVQYQQLPTMFQAPLCYVAPHQQLATPASSRRPSDEGPADPWLWMAHPGAKPTIGIGYPTPPLANVDLTVQPPPPPPHQHHQQHHQHQHQHQQHQHQHQQQQQKAPFFFTPAIRPAPAAPQAPPHPPARRDRKIARRQRDAHAGPSGTFTFAEPIVPGADVYVSAYSHTREYRLDDRGRVQRRRRYQDM
ncbi:MAG: hypothetical protein M1830_006888, partial [Pleopsidium flavum]